MLNKLEVLEALQGLTPLVEGLLVALSMALLEWLERLLLAQMLVQVAEEGVVKILVLVE